MTMLTLTAPTRPSFLPGAKADDTVPAALQGRCSRRVSYAQTTTPTGERAYGHFSLTAADLAATVGRQLPPDTLDESFHFHPSTDLALHRWLRDHNDNDDDSEADEPASVLPAAWPDAEHFVEELFSEGQARVFCACCNHNLPRRDVRLERSVRHADGVHYRYLCAAGHLLLSLRPAPGIATAERHAA